MRRYTLGLLFCLLSSVCAQISDNDLRDVSQQMWEADQNRFTQSDVDYNTGGNVLFNYVDENKLGSSTYNRMQQLRQYFIPEIGVADPPCTGQCQSFQDLFLNELVASPPVQIAHQFLASHGLASNDINGFRNEIRQYFFTRYSRSQGAAIDSSGFEHVFYGEVRNTEVTGFHGWVQTYLLEREGEFTMTNYQQTCNPDVARLSFSWSRGGSTYFKSVSSIAIGYSPEFEIALYTLCFQARQTSSCSVRIDNQLRSVTTFSMGGVSPRTIGTSYISC